MLHPQKSPRRLQDARVLLTQTVRAHGKRLCLGTWEVGRLAACLGSLWCGEMQNAFHTAESNTDLGQELRRPT